MLRNAMYLCLWASMGLVILLGGCSTKENANMPPSGSVGSKFNAVPDSQIFGNNPTPPYALTPAAINDINGGAATTVTDTSTVDLGAFLPPGSPFVPGADYGQSRVAQSREVPYYHPKTLAAGSNEISASIIDHTPGGVYPEPMDFYVPAGFVAQDFRLVSLAGGTSGSGYACQPGFGIYDNWGGVSFSYNAAYIIPDGTDNATRNGSTQSPVPIAQLRLSPLFIGTRLRPYRLFCSGGRGAEAILTCNLVAAVPGGGGSIALGSGAFQVTLTWDTDKTDMDLHVIEPDGNEIYYWNTTSTTGKLDRDDTDGFGPENYYVLSSASPETGTYQIFVRYYDADSTPPSTECLVRVKTLTETKVFSLTLPTEYATKNVARVTFSSSGTSVIDGSVNGSTRALTRLCPKK